MGCFFCFFNDTATTEIYTLSLHDALPISDLVEAEAPIGLERAVLAPDAVDERDRRRERVRIVQEPVVDLVLLRVEVLDRKSTRLNSSHANISYAVFCLKKKKTSHTFAHTI